MCWGVGGGAERRGEGQGREKENTGPQAAQVFQLWVSLWSARRWKATCVTGPDPHPVLPEMTRGSQAVRDWREGVGESSRTQQVTVQGERGRGGGWEGAG